uniref:Uncharacterized protein n=1 Tax=Anguilla anguilla TaxID=7936 RepID=A0A0E9VLY7_ANGAN
MQQKILHFEQCCQCPVALYCSLVVDDDARACNRLKGVSLRHIIHIWPEQYTSADDISLVEFMPF